MSDSGSRFEKLKLKIANNPILASMMVIGMIIIALSTFTEATRNLLGLMVGEKRPSVNGEWVAEIIYPSKKETLLEVFIFSGDDEALHGSASYFEKEQVIVDGRVRDNQIEFKTRTMEYPPDWNNSQRKIATHQYRGSVSADEIEFVMETYGGFSTYPPITFTARKAPHKQKER